MLDLWLDRIVGKIVKIALVHLAGNRQRDNGQTGNIELERNGLLYPSRKLDHCAIQTLYYIDKPDIYVRAPVKIDLDLPDTLACLRLNIIDIVHGTHTAFLDGGNRL